MSRAPFFLSHHRPEHLHRCVELGGWLVCARCLGLYPLLLALVAAQIASRAPMSLPGDRWIAMLLPLPALIDWARGRFDPSTGTNALRLATGALLAVGLARTLYLHLRAPFHPLASAQLGALLLLAAGVELAYRLRRRRAVDRLFAPDVEPSDRQDQQP